MMTARARPGWDVRASGSVCVESRLSEQLMQSEPSNTPGYLTTSHSNYLPCCQNVLKDKEDKVVCANIGCVIEKFHKSCVMPPRKIYWIHGETRRHYIFAPKLL
jgi:hypothetical protein